MNISHIHALTAGQAAGLGVGAIIALVVAGLVAALLITKLALRVAVVVIVLALAVVVWTQRSAVVDAAQDAARRCNTSFFGVHINPSDPGVRRACQSVTGR